MSQKKQLRKKNTPTSSRSLNDTKIPFNQPFIVGRELFNIARAVIENKVLSGDGRFTEKCQDWLEGNLVCTKALLTNSCTAALEMAAILCDIQPGDEIIMPSFTFVSTANAFVLRGGVPVFVDIRADTLNIDEQKIESAITGKTKAIVPVHYGGVPCAMDKILSIGEKHSLFVIEDAAQALLSRYKGRYLGTLGHFSALSFHETKNIICGEGGALIINDESMVDRAEIVWEKGTNRKNFIRGKVDKYSWVDLGSSYLPSEIIAAFLAAQLEQADKIIHTRRKLFSMYYSNLKPLADLNRLRLPYVDKDDVANGHLFYIITSSPGERSGLIQFLRERGIEAVFHYIPLHSSPAGQKFGRVSGQLDMTDTVNKTIVRLPLFYEMTEMQVKRVTSAIFDFYKFLDP